ncbi:hypothetical protein LG329_16665 [Virgibacillus necropolis]|uniref:hypothetical protein n=1 Tax=Virgibacillus necropolis TaxID=163877 RepID=UPI0038517073
MIQTNNLIEISNIEDLTVRSQRVLDEVQPVVRRLMDAFITKFGELDSSLKQLRVHTYESSLKTTISDSKNPKYAHGKQSYGKKAFVELINEHYYETPIVILRIEINLHFKEIRLCMTSDFYPFMIYSRSSQVHVLKQMIQGMDSSLEIFTNEDNRTVIAQDEFIQTVKDYIKNKRRPSISFGKVQPIDEATVSVDEIVEDLWAVYQKLEPVRLLMEKEAMIHSEATQFLNVFKRHTGPFSITMYSKSYQVVTDEALKKVKTNEYKQSFSIYDNDQLISTGHFLYIYREPKEVIGVIMNKRGQIYSNIRDIANSDDIYEWYNKKSFFHRDKYNEQNENRQYQEKSLEELRNHGFRLNDSDAFYVGTYEKENHAFTEPVEMIKERLITASAIFADIRNFITFPKEIQEVPDKNDPGEDDEVESFSSSFDFANIMEFVEQSGFTFSLDIIRDFYLNLTSLDD